MSVLAQRQASYTRAQAYAERVAAQYLTAKASGRVSRRLSDELDVAEAGLRRAKRRLEQAGGSV